jgi:phosphoribosyl-ATP pyrophosphohydrolase/phosphoribosyl-AMP cyclohydrolase
MNLAEIKFDANGLIPAVIQDSETLQVLMVAYMNREALEQTIAKGRTVFWSRSRKKLWEKGETSGNYQHVQEIAYDCDGDTLLIKVNKDGPACHTGEESCFYRWLYKQDGAGSSGEKVLKSLYATILDRKQNPKEGSYTCYLFAKGVDKIGKKIGEEAAEVIIASKNESKEELVYEIADLCYHTMVMMAEKGVAIEDIRQELKKRFK